MHKSKQPILWLEAFLCLLSSLSAPAQDSSNSFSVTTLVNPPWAGAISGGGTFTNGATVMLTVTSAGDCFQFADWSSEERIVSQMPVEEFVVTSNTQIFADFYVAGKNIQTFSDPADAGAITGGGGLECGTNATLTAKPKPGFKFIGWTLNQPGGDVIATNLSYSFAVTNDETFYAKFASIQAPTLAITFPVRGERVNRRTLAVTGRTHDLGIVSGVYCGLAPAASSAFRWVAATTGNHWKNWSADLILFPGTNVLAAYAIDNAGAVSSTNNVVFFNRAAGLPPESLSGLAADVSPNSGPLFGYSFGAATFARESMDTNVSPGVGDYTYTIIGSNTAQIAFNYIAPPTLAAVTDLVQVTFNSPSTAAILGSASGAGNIVLRPVSNSAPPTLERMTILDTSSNTAQYWNGLFAYNPNDYYNLSQAGFYNYTQFTPVSGLIQQVSTNDPGSEDWVVATFQTPRTGTFFATSYGGMGSQSFSSLGTFTAMRLSNIPELAPAYLAGMTGRFVPENQTAYTLSFGEATLAASSSIPNGVTGAANYVYTRTGRNTGKLTFNYITPATGGNASGDLNLFFTTSRGGIYFNVNGYEAGTFRLAAAPATAPASLVGKTFLLRSGAATEIVALGEGVVTNMYPEEGPPISGSYTVFPASPQVDIVTLNFPSNLEVDYMELVFTGANSGSAIYTVTAENYIHTVIGRFTMK